jgi:hypothetical protein
VAITVVQGLSARLGTAHTPAQLSPFVVGSLDAIALLSRLIEERPHVVHVALGQWVAVTDKPDDALKTLISARIRIERSLESYRNPMPRVDSEQMAMTIITSTAEQLDAAGRALDEAAEQLREAGKGLPANRAKQAANAAHDGARGLVG